jgi:protein arginine kinase
MSWYHIPGNQQDVAICTCVSLSRNLSGYPFPARLDAAKARELLNRVGGVLEKNGFVHTDPSEVSMAAAQSLVEKHFMTPRFLRESLPRALYLNEPCNLSVMVCEEDHAVIRSILSGASLKDAFEGAAKVETLLDESFTLAFDERLGYLTASPALIGTAMEASLTLSLPLLTGRGRIPYYTRALEQRGLRMRPVLRESEGGASALWEISNRVTLGVGEEEILSTLDSSFRGLAEEERFLRESAAGEELDRLADRIGRAEGILRHGRLLGSGEAMELLGTLRMGAAMGLTTGVRVEELTALMVEIMPATLTLGVEPVPRTEAEQALLRAKMVRERLFSED